MEPLTGLMLGIAGSMHCVGMCGPIAIVAGRNIPYHLGRIISYTMLGILVGLGSGVITLYVTGQWVSIIAGSLMVLTAIVQLIFHRTVVPSASVLRLTTPIRNRLGTLLQSRAAGARLGIGLLNGLLPCGLVVSAILGAAGTGNTWQGAFFMFLFGVGTLPSMITIAVAGKFFKEKLSSRWRMALPIAALVIGVLVTLRGMGLGIPYVSPANLSPVQTETCSH